MRILILNGSPHKNGTVAKLLKGIVDGISKKYELKSINVYDLESSHVLHVCSAGRTKNVSCHMMMAI